MPQPNSGFSQKQWKITKRRSPNKTERKGERGGAWNFFRKKISVGLHFFGTAEYFVSFISIFQMSFSVFLIVNFLSYVDAPFSSHFGFLLINRKLQKQFLFRTFSKMFLVQYNILLFLVTCWINGKRM